MPGPFYVPVETEAQKRLRRVVLRAQAEKAANAPEPTPPVVPVYAGIHDAPRPTGLPVNRAVFQAGFPLGVAQQTKPPAAPSAEGPSPHNAFLQGVLNSRAGGGSPTLQELLQVLNLAQRPVGAALEVPLSVTNPIPSYNLPKLPPKPSIMDRLGALATQFESRDPAEQNLAFLALGGTAPGVTAADAAVSRMAAGATARAAGRTAVRGAAEAAVRVPVRPIQEAGLRALTGKPGIAGAAAEDLNTLAGLDRAIKKAEGMLQTAKESGMTETTLQRIWDEAQSLRDLRDAHLQGGLSPEDYATYQQLQQRLEEATTKVGGGGKAPNFGSPERAQYDEARALRRAQGIPLPTAKQRTAATKATITSLKSQIAALERQAEQGAPTGAAPTQAGGQIQSSMGIGEKPAQGTILGEFQGKEAPPVPLIDQEAIAARQARIVEVARGQGELPIPAAKPPRVRRAAAPKPVEPPALPATVPAAPAPAGRPPLPNPMPPSAEGGPRGATAPPPAPPQPPSGEDFAANIRLSKYPEDLRATIKEWATENPDEVQAARRGVRSDAQVLDDARQLAEESGVDFAKLQRRWKPGEAWNAEEIVAIRGALRQKTQAVLDAAQVARTDNSAVNHAKLLTAMLEQNRVQEIVTGVTAESGRALRSFRQEAFDAITANDNRKLEELLRRLGDRAKLDDVAAALAKLDINNPEAVNEFLSNASKPSFWDYAMELYINGILSGPKTHIVNALSNTVNALVSPLERAASVGVEAVLAPLQRRPVERFFQEVQADAFGAIEGISEGARAGLDTIKTGINPSQLSKWEFRKTAFRGTLGKVIRAPGTALEAADAMGYAINYRAALNANIVRMARGEGLKGQSLIDRIAELKVNPTKGLIEGARETAEYRLFRGESDLANSILALRGRYPVLRIVIPFLRTPINLVKFGLERSPAGFANPSIWRNLAVKNPEASDQLARAFLGSTLTGLIAWQFAEGRITGAAPKNAAERDRFYREGKLPFAVRIGDTWVQYQRLEPFNQPISQIAAAVEAINSKDKTATEKVQQAGYTMAQNLISQSFLSSLNSLLQAVMEPERYGATFLSREAAGAVPFSSLLRTGAQMTDTTFRRPRTLGEQVQANLPGLSRNVPPVLTALGEEAQRPLRPFSPISISPAKQSALDAELGRLGVEVGFTGKSFGGLALTRDQQDEYQRVAGQLTKQVLVQLIGLKEYQGASDVAKQAMLERAINQARDQARNQLFGKFLKGNVPTPVPPPAPGRRVVRRDLIEAAR